MKVTFKYIILLFILFMGMKMRAQLSQGGYPLELPNLKSTSFSEQNVLKMPSFNLKEELKKHPVDPLMKSIKFAHSFNVNLTPDNSGEWFTAENHRVWQLHIKSDSAKSLSLIFTKYYLPDGARLFVFDPEQEVILGAFTAQNNKSFKKLAVYPLPGNELIVQYEEPLNASFNAELEIGKINHDYIGIVPLKNSRNRRPSGACNVDINCSADNFIMQQRAVCRIIADDEMGTATLINNTADDGKPYVLSAFHIFDSIENAEVTIFDFNYESPFCSHIDGYDLQSISGSTAVAWFDSLDFILVEMSEMPPPEFRPYMVGWDASHKPSTNSSAIHHPNGDTKKISNDQGTVDSMIYNHIYLDYSHWEVGNWESGTTEGGSSGCALFNSDNRLVGTLTGGKASCTELLFDAFARFDKMWDARFEINNQLKHWLDPINLGVEVLDGYDPYQVGKEECTVFSNYLVDDELKLVNYQIGTGGITEVAERYTQVDEGVLSGVAIGIQDYKASTPGSVLTIRIYNGDEYPDQLLQQYHFEMNDLTPRAMNYFSFSEEFNISGVFFVGVVVASLEDSIMLYQSNFRQLAGANTMMVNENGIWENASDYSDLGFGASLLIQPTACNTSYTQKGDTVDKNNVLMKVYPIPGDNIITIEFINPENINELSVSDMVGRLLFKQNYQNRRYIEINASEYLSGIYMVNLISNKKKQTQRMIVY